jgi:hypothetical protein
MVTVGYVKRDENVVDPDPRSWKFSVVHVWASYDRDRNSTECQKHAKKYISECYALARFDPYATNSSKYE